MSHNEADTRAKFSPFMLLCESCGTGLSAGVSELRKHIRDNKWVCSTCKATTPVEQAYLKSLFSPGKNSIFISNYCEMGELDVRMGLTQKIEFSVEMDELLWVQCQPYANYCVNFEVQSRQNKGFVFLTSYCFEKDMLERKDKVKIFWMAYGYKGDSHLHMELLRRAFKILWWVNEWERDYRLILLEGIIAFEAFVAWFIREHLFVDDYFRASNAKLKKIDEFMRAEGIYSITDVVIRSAIRDIDIYRIFKLLRLPVKDSLFSTDIFIDSILEGISLRNKIVHKGLTSLEKNKVKKILGSIYFLIEAIMLHSLDKEQIMKVLKPISHCSYKKCK